MNRLLVWCLILLSFGSHAAEEQLRFARDGLTGEGLIGDRVAYYQVRQGNPGLSEILAIHAEGGFTPSRSRVLNFGIDAPPVWISASLVNTQPTPVPRRLTLGVSWLERVEAFVIEDGITVAHHQFGDAYPFDQRPVEDRNLAFEHVFAPGASQVLLRIDTFKPMLLPISLESPREAKRSQTSSVYSYGLLYGVVSGIMLYNLMLFFSLRYRRYLYYAVYVLFFLLMNMAYTGHGFQWFWPQALVWQKLSTALFVLLYSVSALVFAIHFLDCRRHMPVLQRFIIGACILAIGVFALTTLAQRPPLMLINAFVFTFFTSLAMIFLGVRAVRLGLPAAATFLSATVVAAACASVTAMAVWGQLPFNQLTFRAVEIGMTLEALLLAFALASMFRMSQQGLHQAERLSLTDPLTNISNRRAFYQAIEETWDRTLNAQKPVSLLLIDIDHFKQINDRHGHTDGDRVLVRISQTLGMNLRREDIFVRWGGEEFLLFLPDMPIHEAVAIAERMRRNVQETPINLGESSIQCSVSIGVAGCALTCTTIDDLISEADKRLYQAKNNGRNRVEPQVGILHNADSMPVQ